MVRLSSTLLRLNIQNINIKYLEFWLFLLHQNMHIYLLFQHDAQLFAHPTTIFCCKRLHKTAEANHGLTIFQNHMFLVNNYVRYILHQHLRYSSWKKKTKVGWDFHCCFIPSIASEVSLLQVVLKQSDNNLVHQSFFFSIGFLNTWQFLL